MDKALTREFDQLNALIKAYSPVRAYQYVDVTFGSANADKDILHTLGPTDPESLRYVVVKKDRATDIYNDQSGTRKAWTSGVIYLRSSVASAVVRLLLTVER